MGVVSDATDVGTGLWHLQHPLGHTNGPLCRASGDVLHIVLVLEFLLTDHPSRQSERATSYA